uniref:Uncharacterized protein n=1 Tax=Anguilla anguilla TaxID=7936 RepID=A0A0E9U792_ANGAN
MTTMSSDGKIKKTQVKLLEII